MNNKKYLYRNKQNVKQTADIGQIVPVFWRRYYPGDKIKKLDFENITRMITPLFPTLDNANISLYAFKVPDRILNSLNNITESAEAYKLGKQYELYISGTDEGTYKWINSYAFMNSPHNLNIPETHHLGGLFKKFGIEKFINLPQAEKANGWEWKIKMNAILSYHAIYDSFFRNKEIEEKLLPIALPYMCFGESGENPYNGFELGEAGDWQPADDKNYFPLLDSIGLVASQNKLLKENRFTPLQAGSDFDNFEQMLYNHSETIASNTLIAAQLKNGTNKDTLLKLWNSNNKDKTDPMLLGYYKWEQAIKQITSTSDTNEGKIGDVGGQSVTYNKGALIQDLDIDEHCTIMVVMTSNYPIEFTDYVNQFEWLAETGEYEPGLEEQVDTKLTTDNFLIKAPGQGKQPKVLGYQRNWDYVRHTENKVLGEFRDTLNQWCYTQKNPLNGVGGANSLNTNSLKVQAKPFKDTLTTNEDCFLMEYNFFVDELRTIKPYSDMLEVLTEPIAEE